MPPRFFPLTSASLAAVCLLLLSCALGYLNPNYALPGERRQRLSDAASRYVGFLRFGNVGMAAPFVEPQLRTEFLSTFGPIETSAMRFTEIDVQNIEFTELGRATVLVRARIYRLPSVREVQLIEEQRWRYDPTARTWYVSPDFDVYSPRAGQGRPQPAALRVQ